MGGSGELTEIRASGREDRIVWNILLSSLRLHDFLELDTSREGEYSLLGIDAWEMSP